MIKTENMAPAWDLPPMVHQPQFDRSAGLRKASPGIRASRKKTTIACIHCVKAKAGCDRKRPCGRCVRLGKHNCIDRPINPRYRPRKTPRTTVLDMMRGQDDHKDIL